MGHCGKFDYVMGHCGEVLRCGPLRRIWVRARGLFGKFGHALWATAVICLCAMCHGANLVMHYGPLLRTGYALLVTAVNGYELWALCGIKSYSINM